MKRTFRFALLGTKVRYFEFWGDNEKMIYIIYYHTPVMTESIVFL